MAYRRRNHPLSDPLTVALCGRLGVTGDQAKGGLGSILALAQERLTARDFDRVARYVPGATNCMDTARSLGAFAGPVHNFDGLSSSLERLGISHHTVIRFTPTVLDFVGKRAGADVRDLLAGALGQQQT